MNEPIIIKGDRLIPLKSVEDKVGHGKSWIYVQIKDGTFPDRRMVHGRALWRESEIDAWLAKAWAQAS
ncbi:helix-turn-helix transcriptional regulator [Salinicola corii]|uniref:helix-turn-helix transcriptional regulator n=1 Tax=Salinicola corii TaxID=2606937 RepID=UPI001CA7E558|nr:AlpA family phage regulatory protein [Salinicola corii]